jgi:hypothetical protein
MRGDCSGHRKHCNVTTSAMEVQCVRADVTHNRPSTSMPVTVDASAARNSSDRVRATRGLPAATPLQLASNIELNGLHPTRESISGHRTTKLHQRSHVK